MKVTPTLIKYLIHLGVQLQQSNQFVDEKSINNRVKKIYKSFNNLSFYTGRLIQVKGYHYKLVLSNNNNEEEEHIDVTLSPALNVPPNKIVSVYIESSYINKVVFYDTIN